jgi:DNA-binding SARP family transcriptional activator
MGSLKISLLGVVRIDHEGLPNESRLTRSLKSLLGHLALFRRRTHPREVLAGLFWGDSSEDRARNSLRTALWRLRKVLEPQPIPRGTYLVTTPAGEVGLNPNSKYWLDVAVFENLIKQNLAKSFRDLTAGGIKDLEYALGLYQGELLEGIYDDWALVERERLRVLFIKGKILLLRYYGQREAYEKALDCGRTILSLDPLREKIHREMMRLYVLNGQRALALRQYAICRHTLEKELGVPPMGDTEQLYARIFPKAKHQVSKSPAPEDLRVAPQLLTQVQQVLDVFEESAENLRLISEHLHRITDNKDSRASM